ncbi:MAG TPA: alkaline phosphatase family protein, partial [Candidatus Saccharimonadales bacterium]|nr:alkaline phosphatase family protein [Candidatus Saccharimonadales bacterium]
MQLLKSHRLFQASAASAAWLLVAMRLHGQNGMPRPDHVVLAIEENKSFNAVYGSPSAPYINALAHRSALFISSYAIRHPSQPNYLALFSGSTHGIGDDSCPHTFNAPNLGSALLDAGLSFSGFSESMPRVGYHGCTAGGYARKHAPWVNFSNIPNELNLPYTSFPTNYAELPTLAIVVPNLGNDMHDGPISRGDAWLLAHLDSYVQWAMTNNSLFILTWDEGHNGSDNRIITLFAGAMVRPGVYAERIDHYVLCRTLLEMYGLTPFEKAATADPITSPWTPASAPSPITVSITSPVAGSTVPGPATLQLTVTAESTGSSITNVEFFERATKLGQVASEPFVWTVTNSPPGDYNFVVKATDAAGRRKTSTSVAVRVFDPYPAIQGSYQGLIRNDAEVTPETSGAINLAVAAHGVFSAKTRVGTRQYKFSGAFDGLGQGVATASAPAPVPPEPGVASVILELGLSLNLTNGSNAVFGSLTRVELNAQGNPVRREPLASVEAYRSTFDVRTNPAPLAGHYTLTLAGDGAGVTAPGGDGVAALTVDAGGRVRLAGTLADGTPVSAGGVLAQDGRWPLDVPLLKGAGVLSGWVTLAAPPGVEVSGCPTWIKPPVAAAKYYPGGFRLNACLSGGHYQPP